MICELVHNFILTLIILCQLSLVLDFGTYNFDIVIIMVNILPAAVF